MHVTTFCVDARHNEQTPYTDKVIAFVSHLLEDEKAFFKTANRLRECTLKKLPHMAEV